MSIFERTTLIHNLSEFRFIRRYLQRQDCPYNSFVTAAEQQIPLHCNQYRKYIFLNRSNFLICWAQADVLFYSPSLATR